MRIVWKDVLSGGLTLLKAFGALFAFLVLLSLFLPISSAYWPTVLLTGGSVLAAAFWLGWKERSFLGSMLGVFLAVLIVMGALIALPQPVAGMPIGQMILALLYIPPCVVAFASGVFLLVRGVRKRLQARTGVQ